VAGWQAGASVIASKQLGRTVVSNDICIMTGCERQQAADDKCDVYSRDKHQRQYKAGTQNMSAVMW